MNKPLSQVLLLVSLLIAVPALASDGPSNNDVSEKDQMRLRGARRSHVGLETTPGHIGEGRPSIDLAGGTVHGLSSSGEKPITFDAGVRGDFFKQTEKSVNNQGDIENTVGNVKNKHFDFAIQGNVSSERKSGNERMNGRVGVGMESGSFQESRGSDLTSSFRRTADLTTHSIDLTRNQFLDNKVKLAYSIGKQVNIERRTYEGNRLAGATKSASLEVGGMMMGEHVRPVANLNLVYGIESCSTFSGEKLLGCLTAQANAALGTQLGGGIDVAASLRARVSNIHDKGETPKYVFVSAGVGSQIVFDTFELGKGTSASDSKAGVSIGMKAF